MEVSIQENERKIEVCFTPALFPVYYSSNDCVVVVIDVFRATSAICTAFAHGVNSIIPVSSVSDAIAYKEEGYIVAAERSGEIVKGFDIGNSPFSYMDPKLKGKDVVLTTTNGTKAIERAKAADTIIIGSFLNLEAVVDYLAKKNKNVLLLCAGWKNRFNLEDSLFAGAVAHYLSENKTFAGLADSSLAARALYREAKNDMGAFLKNSSHRKRLERLNLEKDINFCLQESIYSIVPEFKGNALKV